jgi:hypothetical protein
MNIALTNPTSGKVMINADSVRIYVPTKSGKTIIFFNSGERLDVEESIDQIEGMLKKKNIPTTATRTGK